ARAARRAALAGPLQHRTGLLMRIRRWLRRLLAVASVLAVALAVTVVVLARSPAFHDWLRRRVVVELNAALNGVGAIGALDGNLLDHVVLRNVRLVAE